MPSVRFVKFNQWGIGFASISPSPETPQGGIRQSSDSGKSWNPCTIAVDSSFQSQLWADDITFKDSLTGFLCTTGWVNDPRYVGGAIYITTDGGIHWSDIFRSFNWRIRSVLYLRNQLFASVWPRDGNGEIIVSADEGRTWKYSTPPSFYGSNGFATRDSVIIVPTSTYGSGKQLRSSDAGTTWTESWTIPEPISNDNWGVECWQPYTDTLRNLFYMMEDADDDGLPQDRFFRSTDDGISWNNVSSFPFYFYLIGNGFGETGGLDGCTAGDESGNLYIQKVAAGEGLYMSSDSGNTWISICGPSNKWDTRFCVFNNTLFAGGYINDSEGIWALNLSQPRKIILDSDLLISACNNEDSSFFHFVSTFVCPNSVTLDSVSIEGSPAFTAQSELYQKNGINGNDSILVHYRSQNSYDTAKLILHFTINGTSHDSSVTIYGVSKPDTNHYNFTIQELGDTVIDAGDSVGVTFVPGAGTLAATDSVELTLRYDPNALSAPTLTVPAGWWVADSSSLDSRVRGNDMETLTLVLRADSAESLPDPLLHAEFKTYLTPNNHPPSPALERRGGYTIIYLDSAQSFFPQTTPCAPTTLSLQTPDSVEIDFTGCGDSTLLAATQGKSPFSIESIVPNPARTEIRVEGRGQRVEVELSDALGRIVIPSALYALPFTLDVASLPSGSYFLRLSENGYVQTRQVSIER